MMATFWMLEPIPLAATALMPVALFPLLGILSTSEACIPFMKSANMMFIGGLLMAIAIESSNLHKRIALKVLLVVGTSFKRIMLGLMLTTMFLSMWISNTATTAMMVPITEAIITEVRSARKRRPSSASQLGIPHLIVTNQGQEDDTGSQLPPSYSSCQLSIAGKTDTGMSPLPLHVFYVMGQD